MARARTIVDVKRRADRVKAAVLPRLGLGHVLVEKIKKWNRVELPHCFDLLLASNQYLLSFREVCNNLFQTQPG